MTRYGNEKEKMRSLLDPGPVPEIVEMRLREAYAALPERRPARPARPRLRVLRTALAAAALCVALPVTVLAATGELLPMIEGAIAFFRTDAATTLDSIQNTFEAYNAAVALEKTDAGVTFTVDNISVDDNFINLFGRIQATGLRAKLQEANTAGDGNAMFDGQMPDRWAFAYNDMPRPVVRVGDAVYGLDNSLNDSLNFYFQDDDTVCYARRILVNDTLPDSFAMQILPSYATRPAADGAGAEKYQTLLGTEGDWTLECGVDITSTRGAVKNAEPQVLTLGESKLDLKKFSVSPLGAVAVVDEHFTGGIGEGDVVQKDGYTSLEQYAVRDSAGNWMYWMRPSGWTVGEESLYEFVKPADGVDSLTFVPVLYSGTAQAQEALAPLEQGAKLEVTNLSGYTVESFVLDGRRLELTLAPYGPQAYGMVGLEIEPCGADGSPAYDEEQARTCIVDSYTDHATGNVVYTMDFYHDEPLLSSAVQLRYTKLADIALDEANAVTVPLA